MFVGSDGAEPLFSCGISVGKLRVGEFGIVVVTSFLSIHIPSAWSEARFRDHEIQFLDCHRCLEIQKPDKTQSDLPKMCTAHSMFDVNETSKEPIPHPPTGPARWKSEGSSVASSIGFSMPNC